MTHFSDTAIMIVIGYLIVLFISALLLPIESFSLTIIGFILGFLFRPTMPLVDIQVPFSDVITLGLFNRPLELYAQQSFEYMIGFAIVGGLLGYIIKIIRKKQSN